MSKEIFLVTLESTSRTSESNSNSPDWNDSITILIAILLIFLTAATILQNSVLLIAVTFDKRVRQSLLNFFIVNLAVADLLVGLFVIPFGAWQFLSEDWPFGYVFCNIWSAMDVWCCCASVYSLAVIAADRYVAITRPLTYAQIMTHRRHLYLIFGVWFMTGVISLVPILIWPEDQLQLSGRFCYAMGVPHALASTFGGLLIPMILMLVLYWRIYKEAARVGKSLRVYQGNVNRFVHDSRGANLRIHVGGNNSTMGNQAALQKQDEIRALKFITEKKAAWTVGIITGVFFICWLPFFTILLCHGLNINFGVMNRLTSIFIWLGYSNSCLSPIIYVATNRRFKNALFNWVKQLWTESKL